MKENLITFPDGDHSNHNCTIVYDDGSSNKVFADWLHISKLDYWKGWTCDAGVNRISITENYDVYSGKCNNDYLGNLEKGWNLLENSICKRTHCSGCTEDLSVKKYKND